MPTSLIINPILKPTKNNNYYNNKFQKTKQKHFTERHGDWICKQCKNLNFSFRYECNRCKCPKKEEEEPEKKIEENNNKEHNKKTENNTETNKTSNNNNYYYKNNNNYYYSQQYNSRKNNHKSKKYNNYVYN